jgi:hypothetical protein
MPHSIQCPRCRRPGFVRVERVIKGGASHDAHYCGACNHSWEVPKTDAGAPQVPDRRGAPRTTRA